MSTKQCRKCGEIKAIDQFPTYDHGHGTKHRYECRDCRNAYLLATYRRKHPPKPPRTEKRCCECGLMKPLADFYPTRRGSKILHARCIPCTSVVTKRYHGTPEGKRKKRSRHMMAEFGITIETYEAMFAAQGGVCACCGDAAKRLVVDHDHRTNAVRSLLCDCCNAGLGMFKDSPERLHKAVNYLLKHSI